MTIGLNLTIGTPGILSKDSIRTGPLVMVLGIRPDVIRASIIIRELRKSLGKNFVLVWSGQHYSDNLKDVFFRELEIGPPDIDLQISGENDAELTSSMIMKLFNTLQELKPVATVFLGDTNTVMGTVSAAQLNIPILHIEGCMRSYDWRMPEEKYRTIADHLSDRIYSYLESYKVQGIAEGIPDANILITGNPIVDVLEEYFISGRLRLPKDELLNLLRNEYEVESGEYLVMTCHRRENVENKSSLINILDLAKISGKKVLFFAGYRTQKMLKQFNLDLPDNVLLYDPIGYLEILELINSSCGVLTDSGTIVEEAAIIGIPTIQMRKATERPEVYEFKASIKFDPDTQTNFVETIEKFNSLVGSNWTHVFGDGRASYRIVEDLVASYIKGEFSNHQPEKYAPYSSRSFRSD